MLCKLKLHGWFFVPSMLFIVGSKIKYHFFYIFLSKGKDLLVFSLHLDWFKRVAVVEVFVVTIERFVCRMGIWLEFVVSFKEHTEAVLIFAVTTVKCISKIQINYICPNKVKKDKIQKYTILIQQMFLFYFLFLFQVWNFLECKNFQNKNVVHFTCCLLGYCKRLRMKSYTEEKQISQYS